ncbi:MAG: serine hydrolase domain-containing protein [Chitinispirillaceae bacterium]
MTEVNSMLERMKCCLQDAIENKVFPGCVVGVVNGENEHYITQGHHTFEQNSEPMSFLSVFDCASVTKAIPVSSIALQLIDQNRITTTDRMVDFLPEYKGTYREEIQIRHLLTHTLDFDFRLSRCKDMPPEKILEAVLNVRMKSRPGETYCYANATSILLGMVIERICGKSLPETAQERIFDPVGMDNSTFFPEKIDNQTIIPTEIDTWRGRVIRGEVHDESAWALRPLMVAGSAGLFSNAPDLLNFMKMVLSGGVARDNRILSSGILDEMCTDQIPEIEGCVTGLGWELDQPYMGTKRTCTTFGKTGFTGCAVIGDRQRNAALVVLSNFTWPTRKQDRKLINRVRSDLADMLWESVPKTG